MSGLGASPGALGHYAALQSSTIDGLGPVFDRLRRLRRDAGFDGVDAAFESERLFAELTARSSANRVFAAELAEAVRLADSFGGSGVVAHLWAGGVRLGGPDGVTLDFDRAVRDALADGETSQAVDLSALERGRWIQQRFGPLSREYEQFRSLIAGGVNPNAAAGVAAGLLEPLSTGDLDRVHAEMTEALHLPRPDPHTLEFFAYYPLLVQELLRLQTEHSELRGPAVVERQNVPYFEPQPHNHRLASIESRIEALSPVDSLALVDWAGSTAGTTAARSTWTGTRYGDHLTEIAERGFVPADQATRLAELTNGDAATTTTALFNRIGLEVTASLPALVDGDPASIAALSSMLAAATNSGRLEFTGLDLMATEPDPAPLDVSGEPMPWRSPALLMTNTGAFDETFLIEATVGLMHRAETPPYSPNPTGAGLVFRDGVVNDHGHLPEGTIDPRVLLWDGITNRGPEAFDALRAALGDDLHLLFHPHITPSGPGAQSALAGLLAVPVTDRQAKQLFETAWTRGGQLTYPAALAVESLIMAHPELIVPKFETGQPGTRTPEFTHNEELITRVRTLYQLGAGTALNTLPDQITAATVALLHAHNVDVAAMEEQTRSVPITTTDGTTVQLNMRHIGQTLGVINLARNQAALHNAKHQDLDTTTKQILLGATADTAIMAIFSPILGPTALLADIISGTTTAKLAANLLPATAELEETRRQLRANKGAKQAAQQVLNLLIINQIGIQDDVCVPPNNVDDQPITVSQIVAGNGFVEHQPECHVLSEPPSTLYDWTQLFGGAYDAMSVFEEGHFLD